MAEGLGYHPEVILAGRRINDNMADFVVERAISEILNHKKPGGDKIKVGVLGVTFKENVPDTRNTKVIRMVKKLREYGAECFLVDPVADHDAFHEEYDMNLCTWDAVPKCDAIIVAVAHEYFVKMISVEVLLEKLSSTKVVLDLKNVVDRKAAAKHGVRLWRL